MGIQSMKTILSIGLGLLASLSVFGAGFPVYIGDTNNFWRLGGAASAYVELVSSNVQRIAINTNTGRIGINSSNANVSGVTINGALPPATNSATTGTSMATPGRIVMSGSVGGNSSNTGDATGGAGGGLLFTGGAGGEAGLSTVNAVGGNGGVFTFSAGTGGGAAANAATNSVTGGNGATASFSGGAGGIPSVAATNTVTGNGGNVNLTGGASAAPSAGWSRKTGSGGTISILAGSSGAGTRTNSGAGGTITLTGGNSGDVSTAPGDPGTAGLIELLAGSGGSGGTNANGASIFATGGTGVISGDVIVGRTSAGTARGGLMVGPPGASITNILGGSLSLDFPNTLTLTSSDLPITVTGVTSNNCSVIIGVPWEAVSGGGSYSHFESNDVVYVRFSNNTVGSINPTPATFTVIAFKIR